MALVSQQWDSPNFRWKSTRISKYRQHIRHTLASFGLFRKLPERFLPKCAKLRDEKWLRPSSSMIIFVFPLGTKKLRVIVISLPLARTRALWCHVRTWQAACGQGLLNGNTRLFGEGKRDFKFQVVYHALSMWFATSWMNMRHSHSMTRQFMTFWASHEAMCYSAWFGSGEWAMLLGLKVFNHFSFMSHVQALQNLQNSLPSNLASFLRSTTFEVSTFGFFNL